MNETPTDTDGKLMYLDVCVFFFTLALIVWIVLRFVDQLAAPR